MKPSKLTYNLFIRIFFSIFFLGIIVYNLGLFYKENERIFSFKKLITHQIIAYQFAGLENYTKNLDYLGYYTDAKPEDEAQAKLLAYAQYLVAPTIVDFNNLDHEYILFVCSSEEAAYDVMRKIGAKPVVRNPHGMILAKKQ
jgi:hypothetical protein